MSTVPTRGTPRPQLQSPSPLSQRADARRAVNEAWPMPPAPRAAATSQLARSCRRVIGWIAPRRVAAHYLDLFGSGEAAPTPASTSCGGARGSRLWLADRTLALTRWGDPQRQPFVLLASSVAAWVAPWVQALTQSGHAVLCFHRESWTVEPNRPSTWSECAADLHAICQRFGRADAVIGHAAGAAAILLAQSRGLDARRIILLSAQAHPRDAVARFAHRLGVGDAVARHLARLLEQRSGVALDALQAPRITPAIATPTLVVHDLMDADVPWSEGECIARHLPASRLLTTADLGHQGVLRDATVLRSCMRFLAGDVVGDRIVSSPNLPYGIA